VGWGVETLQRCNVVSNMKKNTQNSKARGCERDEKKKLHISDWLNWRKGDLVDVWLIFKKSWEIIFIYTYIHKSESTMKRLKMKNKTVTWKVNSNWCLVSFFLFFSSIFCCLLLLLLLLPYSFSFLCLLISTVIADHFNPRSRLIFLFCLFCCCLHSNMYEANGQIIWCEVWFSYYFFLSTTPAAKDAFTPPPRELSEKLSCYLFQLAAVRKFKCVKYFPNFFFSFDAVYFIILLPVSRTDHDDGGLM